MTARTDADGPGGGDHSGDARRLRLRVGGDTRALGALRRLVACWAGELGLADDVLVDLQLALNEAVSNGIEHAYGGADASPDGVAVEVELLLTPPAGAATGVRVVVQDHGRWRPVPTSPGHRGRGLALIGAVSRGFRVSSSSAGTRVCFEIPVGG